MPGDGNKFILVTMDYFSNWIDAITIPNQETVTVAEVLIIQWVSIFEMPVK